MFPPRKRVCLVSIAAVYVTNVTIKEEIERVFTLHTHSDQSIEKTGVIIYMIDVPTVEDSGLALILSVPVPRA